MSDLAQYLRDTLAEKNDTIARLRAENTSLSIEVKELAGEVDFQKDKVKSHGENVARLRARVEKLEGALKRIAADDEEDADLNEWGAAAVARAALGDTHE